MRLKTIRRTVPLILPILLMLSLMPTSGFSQKSSKGKTAKSPNLAERTFSASLKLDVWIISDDWTKMESIGKTPSPKPLKIPSCVSWGVTPKGNVDMQALTELVASQKIPALQFHKLKKDTLEQLKGLTKLQGLWLRRTNVKDANLVHLKGLASLRWLNLSLTRISDKGLVHIKGLVGLKRLDLTADMGSRITNAGLAHIKEMTGLEVLKLGRTDITDAGLEHLKGLARLRHLDLSGNMGMKDPGLVHLKGMKTLEIINFADTKITASGMANLKDLTELRELSFFQVYIQDAGVAHLKGLVKLQKLNLYRTCISDAALAHIAGLAELESLNLGDNRGITDAGFKLLRDTQFWWLEDLNLRSTSITDASMVHFKDMIALERLNLQGTNISGTGLVHLKGLKGLRELRLEYAKITNPNIVHLQALTGLKLLGLSTSMKITPENLTALEKALPKTKITGTVDNTPPNTTN